MDRSLPDLRRHWRRRSDGAALEVGLDAFSWADVTDSIWLTVAGAVLVALIVLVALPLIGVALELVFLIALFSSGILGRVLLRRPWIVEAANLSHPERSAAVAVKGWRRSGRAIDELATAISASGLPQRLSGGTPIAANNPT